MAKTQVDENNVDTFIDLELGDAVELEAQPEGEYHVRCTQAQIKVSQNTGGKFLILRLDIPEIISAKGITHVMMFPTPDDEAKQANNRKLAIREACEAFGVTWAGGFSASDFESQEAWAYLAVEESDEYGEQNRVRRWVTGA